MSINYFKTMPNFRAFLEDEINFEKKIPTIYRSSRPDHLDDDDVEKFQKLKIKCIIDFRSEKEYKKADGAKNLDKLYQLNKIQLPKPWQKMKIGEKVTYKPIKNCEHFLTDNRKIGNHVFIDFYRLNYVSAVFIRAPWYLQIISLLFLLFDLMFNTHYKHFVRFFAKHVLNPAGLIGQYEDMCTYSQASICSALKLLTDKNNIPAMLNCAHGKDRTGIISALVMYIVGKSRPEIFKEYGKSADGLQYMQARLYKEIVENLHMCPTFTSAEENTMCRMFEFLDRHYGSPDNFLEFIGFGKDEQICLSRNLLSKVEMM